MRIEAITLQRLCVPLTHAYRIALAELRHFDTIIVEVEAENGSRGFGEATVLTGYTQETISQSWSRACALAKRVVGLDTRPAKNLITQSQQQTPFACTALGTAIEMTEGCAWLASGTDLSVPLLAVLHGQRPDELANQVERLLADGFVVFKVKVGFDLRSDLERVRVIQRLLHGRARLRLDANQGYTRAQACEFVTGLDPDAVELFEQPCAAKDWAANEAVAASSAVPVMLDESIYANDDIGRAASAGASYVKLKLMKMGTLATLVEALARVHALGLRCVLGNGVACDIGCWMEAMVAGGCLQTTSEMNGFLKPEHSLFVEPLRLNDGNLLVPAGFHPRIDGKRVAACLVEDALYRS
jgi:o-succinylbenzoate synthase